MHTRRTLYILIAALVSALVLVPWRGHAWSPDIDTQPIPVQAPLSPDGHFVGTLTIESVTVADAGQLLLTGVLHGTVTHRYGVTTRVRHLPITAPAVPIDDAQTTDVLLLKVAPITLGSMGRQLVLGPVPLDIEAVPGEDLLFPGLLNYSSSPIGRGRG